MPSVGETTMKNTLIITALLCFCLKGYAQTNLDETYDSLFELGGQVGDLQDETLSIAQSLIDSNAGIAVDVAHTVSDLNESTSYEGGGKHIHNSRSSGDFIIGQRFPNSTVEILAYLR